MRKVGLTHVDVSNANREYNIYPRAARSVWRGLFQYDQGPTCKTTYARCTGNAPNADVWRVTNARLAHVGVFTAIRVGDISRRVRVEECRLVGTCGEGRCTRRHLVQLLLRLCYRA